MHEQHKIYEAHYFLLRADECGENAREFSYNLSAFLTAARSVLQYARDEAKTRPGGQAWYHASVSAIPEVRFLKDKRDISVHERPVVPTRRLNVSIKEHLVFGDSVNVTVTRPDGTVEPDDAVQPVADRSPDSKAQSPSTVSFFFPDWSGPDDAMAICITYINAIEDIVRNGRALGYIT